MLTSGRLKQGDIIKHSDGFHAYVLGRNAGDQSWKISAIEPWAKTHTRCTARQVIGIYRLLKGSQ